MLYIQAGVTSEMLGNDQIHLFEKSFQNYQLLTPLFHFPNISHLNHAPSIQPWHSLDSSSVIDSKPTQNLCVIYSTIPFLYFRAFKLQMNLPYFMFYYSCTQHVC